MMKNRSDINVNLHEKSSKYMYMRTLNVSLPSGIIHQNKD